MESSGSKLPKLDTKNCLDVAVCISVTVVMIGDAMVRSVDSMKSFARRNFHNIRSQRCVTLFNSFTLETAFRNQTKILPVNTHAK